MCSNPERSRQDLNLLPTAYFGNEVPEGSGIYASRYKAVALSKLSYGSLLSKNEPQMPFKDFPKTKSTDPGSNRGNTRAAAERVNHFAIRAYTQVTCLSYSLCKLCVRDLSAI